MFAITRKLSALTAVGFAVCATVAQAAPIVTFAAQPVSGTLPELSFAGASGSRQLVAGSGAVGNGDGALPVATQTPGGLQIDTPFIIPAVPGSSINVPTSSTTFYDVTLNLTGLTATPAATVVSGVIIQPMTAGTFSLTSTTGIPLLSGTINSAVMNGLAGANTGAVLSATVTYTGGLIHAALLGAGGTTTGDLSWSFLDASPALSVDGGNFLNSFDANATGLLSTQTIPEPATFALAGLAGFGLARRRGKM